MEKAEMLRILESAYFGRDPHEAAELRELPSLLAGVDVFVDVGASLGQYTAAANRVLAGKRIVCVEPDPVRCERLRELATTFEPRGRNLIDVVWGAAAETSGEGDFTTTDSDVSGSIVGGLRVVGRSVRVPYHRLDDLVPERAGVFVKIDVEGAEYLVLRGAPRLLAAPTTRLLVELHSWGGRGYFPEHVLWLLWRAGFACERTAAHHYFTHDRTVRRQLFMAREATRFRAKRWIARARNARR